MENIEGKTKNAFKWSTITEIFARIIQPITNMILARLLLPEAFGVLSTIMMVIAFAEVFVESGFQKFLIQHEFSNVKEEREYLSVAFWTNLVFSLFIYIVLTVFSKQLVHFVGNDELGLPLSVISIVVPIYGIIGIQNCQLRKSLNFKKLFYVRISAALVPLFITIPSALIGMDFWALIVGNIAGAIVRSVMLYFVGHFKPSFYFNLDQLKHMLKAGMWTLLDGIAVWATLWLDTFLIARNLSNYHLGIYKNSITTITEFFAIVTSAITPVLFASLSRVQNNNAEFNKLFLKVQKTLSIFLIPMGAGLYFHSGLATEILFGPGWEEASRFIGVTSIAIALRTIFVSFYSEAYRAKGKFQIPLYMQLLDILILVPTCTIAVKQGFWQLVYARAFVRLDLILPGVIVIWLVCRISLLDTIKVVVHPIIATSGISVIIVLIRGLSSSYIWQFTSIVISIGGYFVILFLFKEERDGYLAPVLNRFRK